MALIATDTPRTSQLIKYELDPFSGYCRTTLSLTVPTGGFSMGQVLDESGVLIVKATVANAKYVVIDPNCTDYAVGATVNLLVMESGPAILGDASLVFGSDVTASADIATAVAALKALGMKTAKQI